jgi:hypothetical protein
LAPSEDGKVLVTPVTAGSLSQVASSGATIRPVYGERCPVMYHLFEVELKTITALNTLALIFFSFGGFISSCIVSIVISCAFATPPLSELGDFLYRKAVWYLAIFAGGCFVAGGYCVWSKRSAIKQIKDETKTGDVPSTAKPSASEVR